MKNRFLIETQIVAHPSYVLASHNYYMAYTHLKTIMRKYATLLVYILQLLILVCWNYEQKI